MAEWGRKAEAFPLGKIQSSGYMANNIPRITYRILEICQD